MSSADASFDVRQLMADIDREVRERRAAGDLTPEFEHQLDAAFARVAPVGAVEGDLPILLDKIEASTTIDFLAPLPSQPVLRETRRVIRRAIRADLRHLGVQVGGLAQALARSLRCVAERLDAVEASVADVDQALLQISPQLTGRCALPQGPWKNVCADVFAHLKGRVLVAECGDGHLLGELGDAGVDAYGVDPDENIVLDVALRGLDVRTARPEQHLRLLDEASLAGIVLCGCVDRRTPDGQLALMDLSVSRLAPEGSLIVITHDPHSWSSARPMLSELSPGHPLTAASWKALFAARALRECSVHPGSEHPSDGAPGYAVSARR